MRKGNFLVNQTNDNTIKKQINSVQIFIQKFKMHAIINWIKDKWYMLVNENDNPHAIAMGLSIGVFGGIVPVLGLQTLLIILLLWITRRPNYAAAMFSSFIMNQFTILPILYIDYKVGIIFIQPKHMLDFMSIKQLIADKDIIQLLYVGKGIFYPLLLGGILCGLLFSVLTYGISFYILRLRQERIMK